MHNAQIKRLLPWLLRESRVLSTVVPGAAVSWPRLRRRTSPGQMRWLPRFHKLNLIWVNIWTLHLCRRRCCTCWLTLREEIDITPRPHSNNNNKKKPNTSARMGLQHIPLSPRRAARRLSSLPVYWIRARKKDTRPPSADKLLFINLPAPPSPPRGVSHQLLPTDSQHRLCVRGPFPLRLWLIRPDASRHRLNRRLMWAQPAARGSEKWQVVRSDSQASSYLCGCCHHARGVWGLRRWCGGQLTEESKLPGESFRQSRLQKVGR